MIVPNEVVAHIIGKGKFFIPNWTENFLNCYFFLDLLNESKKPFSNQSDPQISGGVLIKELSTIACCQRIDIQQEMEMNRMTHGFYGRSVIISGDFSKRLHVVYLLLRQVNRDAINIVDQSFFLTSTQRDTMLLDLEPFSLHCHHQTHVIISLTVFFRSKFISQLTQDNSLPQPWKGDALPVLFPQGWSQSNLGQNMGNNIGNNMGNNMYPKLPGQGGYSQGGGMGYQGAPQGGQGLFYPNPREPANPPPRGPVFANTIKVDVQVILHFI